jgi:hypothetical protein
MSGRVGHPQGDSFPAWAAGIGAYLGVLFADQFWLWEMAGRCASAAEIVRRACP